MNDMNDIEQKNKQRGFVEIIIVVVIVIAILAYFGVTASDITHSKIYMDYIAPASSYIWNTVIVGFIWHGLLGFFGAGGGGVGTASSTATSTMSSSTASVINILL